MYNNNIMLTSKKRIHIFYSGRVQGVGFRFTAENLANNLKITGWVKNLSDARVEILAEGEESALRDYIFKIKNYFDKYIDDVEENWLVATGEFPDFSIKF